MELNQKSIKAIITALGIAALFAGAYFTIRHKADAELKEKEKAAAEQRAESREAPSTRDADKEREKQKKVIEGYGGQCKSAIDYLAASAKAYKEQKGAYPISMTDLEDFDPRASEMVNNQTHWVQNGNPEIDSFFAEKFTLTGYCSDGFKYYYDTEAGVLQHEKF